MYTNLVDCFRVLAIQARWGMCLLAFIKKTVLGTATFLLELESFADSYDVLDGIYGHLYDAYTGRRVRM